MKITLIAGARPNFIKIAPIIEAIKTAQKTYVDLEYRLIHTGQHFDETMSKSFFEELQIPEPDVNLGCGGGTQAEQTAAIMIKFERDLLKFPADLVLVVGDVTSTMACSIVAQKLNTKVAHVEAGIRSGDWSMPEEINRLVTDSITNYFFTTTLNASSNLINCGIDPSKIYFVGNTMIDTLIKQSSRLKAPPFFFEKNLQKQNYLILTLHRPSNVDNPKILENLLDEITMNSNELPVVFPIHPRTKKIFDLLSKSYPNLLLCEPLGYLNFNFLVKNSKAVITDSGGITEETTVYGIPCMTLRNTTERPETCIVGTNELLGTDPKAIKPAMERLFKGEWKKGATPDLWDGHSANRIVTHITELFMV
jgi:UDP-N-acetylglucosamine 2-epimerase (non-hydrolysing)